MEDQTNPFICIMGSMSWETIPPANWMALVQLYVDNGERLPERYSSLQVNRNRFIAFFFTRVSSLTDYLHEGNGLGLAQLGDVVS